MMMKHALALTISMCFSVAVFAADGPDAALQQARQQIASKQFAEAITTLQAALSQTDALDPKLQTQARTAIHFYAAVAASALRRDEDAMGHLFEVMKLSPSIRSVDKAKYDAHFVELFNRARGDLSGSERFENLYPAPAQAAAKNADESIWGENIAVQLLASRDERRDWSSSTAPADRERFLSEFWRTRDRNPTTPENEFRDTFTARVAFADGVFALPGERGSLTDRGRVFVVLGPPAFVRRRALGKDDAITSMNVGAIGIEVGTIEHWVYTREQLPIAFSKPTVTYQFISHQGVGQFVLQKDGIPMSALAASAAVGQKK